MQFFLEAINALLRKLKIQLDFRMQISIETKIKLK